MCKRYFGKKYQFDVVRLPWDGVLVAGVEVISELPDGVLTSPSTEICSALCSVTAGLFVISDSAVLGRLLEDSVVD